MTWYLCNTGGSSVARIPGRTSALHRHVDECRDGDLLIGAAENLLTFGENRLALVVDGDPLVVTQACLGVADQRLDRAVAGLRVGHVPRWIHQRPVPATLAFSDDVILDREGRYPLVSAAARNP